MKEINGEHFFYKVLAGINRVIRAENHLNDINFFPVPDGDTGTNLALTYSSILKNTRPDESLAVTARAIAEAAFHGARGNAGIIMAQFLKGLSDSFSGKPAVNVRDYSAAVRRAVTLTYESVLNPVEGTVLTVMKRWSDALNNLIGEVDDFRKLFTRSLKTAQEALSGTMHRLKVLKKNRVVDAGGKGFVLFLQGILDFLEKGKRMKPVNYQPEISAEHHHPDLKEEDIRYRYCTQFILENPRLGRKDLVSRISGLGDSLIIGGGAEKYKIHIHTSRPERVTEILLEEGDIRDPVVEDMRLQTRSRQKKRPVALVTDSACDLPEDTIERYRIFMVPISIFYRSHIFLDKITLKPAVLYRKLDATRDAPSSSQPNIQTFRKLYRALLVHYQRVISLHLSSALSGTCNSARQAADLVNPDRIHVVDTATLSTALGLQVLDTARRLRTADFTRDLEGYLQRLSRRATIYVAVRNLKYMVRGGRVSPFKGLLARVLNLKPIISLDPEGRSTLIGKAFGFSANLKKMKELALGKARAGKMSGYAVGHVNNPELARSLAGELQAAIGKPPEYITDVSPLIGMHAGPGSVSVSLLTEDP